MSLVVTTVEADTCYRREFLSTDFCSEIAGMPPGRARAGNNIPHGAKKISHPSTMQSCLQNLQWVKHSFSVGFAHALVGRTMSVLVAVVAGMVLVTTTVLKELSLARTVDVTANTYGAVVKGFESARLMVARGASLSWVDEGPLPP